MIYINKTLIKPVFLGNMLDLKMTHEQGEVTPPVPMEKYWNPPIQNQSTYKPWSYIELIAEYDKLMKQSHGYIKKYRYEKNSVPVLTNNGNYELFHYVLEPLNYSKTIFIQAGIHGNEMDSKQQLLRIVDILVNKTNASGYEVFRSIKDDVRLVIIPCVSPHGHDNVSMNVPYVFENNDVPHGLNLNRNYDFNQQYAVSNAGVGGYPSFCLEEVQHTRDIIEDIGAKNIDYAMDWHDGGNVKQHYWINYAVDGENRVLVNDFIGHLIKKYSIQNPAIENCKDTQATGICAMYFAKTLGIIGSTVEWMGGLLGYNFDSDQMTKSLEIRGNMLLLAYKEDIKGWKINELSDSQYFQFDYPKSFTKEGFRMDAADPRTVVTDKQIYDRWNNLQSKNSSLINKSAKLGVNAKNQDIYTYTFGNGEKKVLYIGGIMRYGATNKINEFAIYQLIEYLCDDYIVNQSKFLQDLRDNYKIIILPCIDNIAANNATDKYSGLNNMALSYQKWRIVDGKCQPTSNALTYHDIPIVKAIIDNNKDLKCIVSGGEDCSKYGANSQDYTTSFETHIVTPKNQMANISNYINHLENNRNEFVVIENTKGTTFGDYAYDNYNIPTYFVQLKVSKRFTELANYHTLSEVEYLHSNYESGRRIANIVNLFLT